MTPEEMFAENGTEDEDIFAENDTEDFQFMIGLCEYITDRINSVSGRERKLLITQWAEDPLFVSMKKSMKNVLALLLANRSG